MTTMQPANDRPVRKSVTVQTDIEDAFRVFTEGFDSWWPRSHHIGKSPMKRAVIEGRSGGRCYTEQEDGTDCDWGSVLIWQPPHRMVLAWQITPQWGYEPELSKSSEVEVTFTQLPDGATRVDLEHRYFSRLGPGGDAMRNAVESEGGWGSLFELFKQRAEQEAATKSR